MKKTGITRYAVLSAAALLAGGLTLSKVQATPYASCITNDASGNVYFFINENGGNVVVTYDGGSTNANFNGINTGTNVTAGKYSFSLTGHTTYQITVTKTGNGTGTLEPNPVQSSTNFTTSSHTSFGMFVAGSERGVDVNRNPTSPYFGRIYLDRSNPGLLWCFNSDGTFPPNTPGAPGSTVGISFVSGNGNSPWRMGVAPDDFLLLSDFATTGSAIYRIDPNVTTNQVFLGPVGVANGYNIGAHGSEESRPLLIGDLNLGANLLEVDGDLGDTSVSQIGSSSATQSHNQTIYVYSNLTYSTLPAVTPFNSAPPNLTGPGVGLTAYSGEFLGPLIGVNYGGGYLYCSDYRSGVTAGDPADVQVYNVTNFAQVWNSRYNGGSSDYFFTSGSGPVDIGVSPDGKYVATMGIDNHLTICALTNGIPDVSTIYVIPGTYTAGNGRGLCWDAADNIYTISSGLALLQAWTLGLSTAATTVGNASGTTFFGLTFINPVITVYATNNSVISQANSYGNPTNGFFTIVRSGGNLSSTLTVNFTYSGTATNGTYVAGNTGSIVFAAGQTTTNISIKSVTDGIPRLTTYVTLTAAPSSSYTLSGAQATISILNTATPYLVASAGAPTMYNAFSNDYATIVITRLGDTNTTESVTSFTTAGTATQGTDFTAPTPVTFSPGDLAKTSFIYPLVGGALPTHSPTQTYAGNKTAVIGVGSGSGYNPAANTATLAIVDSATPPATVLFADALSDPTDAGNWNILAANGNLGNVPTDVDVEFGYDLTTGPNFPIPFPPNGSQYALKMTVNKLSGQGPSGGPMTAVNAYLTNKVFGGNYAVRFNMNVIEPGDLTESGSFNDEEGPFMGINHNGMQTNWFAGSGFAIGAGETSWAADGIFYWISDSGGRYDDVSIYGVNPYREFSGNGDPATNSGWAQLGTQVTSTFANYFKTNVFTCASSAFLPPQNGGWTEGGPGLPVNGSAIAGYGLSVSSWADVEIRQLNGIVSLLIDKVPIFTYTNTTMFTNGCLMLGYEDPWNGGEIADTAVYYSNLRVVAIGGPLITTAGADTVHHTTLINFSISDDDANAFKVVGSSTVNGTYVNIPGATVTSLGGGMYQAVVPQSGPTGFYRILQQ